MRNLLIASVVFFLTSYNAAMLRRPTSTNRISHKALVGSPVLTHRKTYATKPTHSMTHNDRVSNLYRAITVSAKKHTGRIIFINNLQQAIEAELTKNLHNYNEFTLFSTTEMLQKNRTDREKLLSLNAALTDAVLKYCEDDLEQGTNKNP